MANQTLLNTLRNRATSTDTWQKIPWNDPDFSERMLEVHLDQHHDMASRRMNIIDEHVAWIHQKALGGKPASILDLGCGPGFYMERLTALGHTCIGIDFSPASIGYAKKHNAGTYHLDNIITADYGTDYDVVMHVFGELNAFSPQDAQTVIHKAYEALKPGGKLILEVSYAESLARHHSESSSWYTEENGLLSPKPHLVLQESYRDIDCYITNFYILEDGSDSLTTYTSMHQSYSDDEYRQMVRAFDHAIFYPSLRGIHEESADFFAIVATK